jgi:hypothetical protein
LFCFVFRYNCGLGEEGLSVVIKVFESTPSLEELDIGGNIVKSRGGASLQTFLTLLSVFVTKNQSLRVLKMAGQVGLKDWLNIGEICLIICLIIWLMKYC